MIGPIAARTPPKAPAGRAVAASSRPPVVTAAASGGAKAAQAFDVARLKGALDAAGAEADALILRFEEGAEAGASAFTAARIELARAKLKALKLAAAVNAVRRDADAALGVAEEAATVARDLEGLRGDPSGADAGMAIDALAQAARKVIAIARKAASPDSPEDKAAAALQEKTGVPDPTVDTVGDGDMALAAEDVSDRHAPA